MEALLQKTKQWESQNNRILKKILHVAAKLSVESVKAIASIVSFLVYLAFVAARTVLILGNIFFRGPRLIRRLGPHQRPEVAYEFEHRYREYQLRSRRNNGQL